LALARLFFASPNFAFFVHGRGHAVAYESRALIYGWFDSHLKPAEATQSRLAGEAPGPPPR
jgi:hypothetical protein